MSWRGGGRTGSAGGKQLQWRLPVNWDSAAPSLLPPLSQPSFAPPADTIRTVEAYADIVVLRHFQAGSAEKAAAAASIPIINAGDGPGQHPTQVGGWAGRM
jgi:hypothetical protein